MDGVVHFEIPYDDSDRASEFYEKVFGWKIQPMPEMSYSMVHTIDVDEKQMPVESGKINGGMFGRKNDLKNPVIVIKVEELDASLEKIEEQGGEIVRGKRAVGEMGFVAYFKDTEGNVVGLWQDNKSWGSGEGESDEAREIEEIAA